MRETIKKSKFFLGIALMAQSVMCVTFFFALWRKKKSLANTFLAVGAAGGLWGAYLIYKNAKEMQREQKILSAMDAFCEGTDDYIFDDEWVALRDKDARDDENKTDGEEKPE